jgi:hypothetical protein
MKGEALHFPADLRLLFSFSLLAVFRVACTLESMFLVTVTIVI